MFTFAANLKNILYTQKVGGEFAPLSIRYINDMPI